MMPRRSGNKFFIIIDGPMGAGKTTVSKILHPRLKRTVHLNRDNIKWWLSDYRRIKPDFHITSRVIYEMARVFLHQGVNILLEQGFWGIHNQKPYIRLAKRYGLVPLVYHIQAPLSVLKHRVHTRPRPIGERIPISRSRMLKNFKTHIFKRSRTRTIFDSSILSSREIANLILRDVKSIQRKNIPR